MPDREVRIAHVFEAPREEVFAAWTDADQVAEWWSPDGFHIPRDSVVVEPWVGGRFHLTMVQSPEAEWPMRAEIVEISPPELLVMRTEPIPAAGIAKSTLTRVVFEVEGTGTRMTITDGPYSDAVYGNTAAGWRNLVLNLEALLR